MSSPSRGFSGVDSATRKAVLAMIDSIGARTTALEVGGVGSKGEKGDTGAAPQLRVFDGHIQWRTVDADGVASAWTNLISVESLRGATGDTPTGQAVVDAIAEYFVQDPFEPTDEQVATALDTYFATHPLPKGDTGATGPAPTQQQLIAAVSAYLTDNPLPQGPKGDTGDTGPGPSDAQVAGVVAEYLTLHPPAAGPQGPAGPAGATGATGATGRAPTEAEIAAAVTSYLAANPPAAGPTGPTGPAGRAPTEAEIASAVASYLAAHPPAAGAAGEDGAAVFSGTGGPSSSGEVTGDHYLNLTNGDLYRWSGLAWSVVGNLRGPTGSTGSTGPAGAAGASAWARGSLGSNYVLNRWIAAQPQPSTTSYAASLNELLLIPIVFDRAGTLTGIGVQVTTSGGASSVLRSGVYASTTSTTSYSPTGAPLATSSTVSASTTGFKSWTTYTLAVTAGVYFIGVVFQGATGQLLCSDQNLSHLIASSGTPNVGRGSIWSVLNVSGSLPSVAPSIMTTTNIHVMVQMSA